MEEGDKILLPPSAFQELGRCLITYPMMFEVKNPVNQAVTHCGVMEFTAPEGMAYFPYWMMAGLCLQNGSIVDIRSASLKKGTYVKFQPHKTKFTTLSNPRIVLEKALRAFSCLSKGSTIAIKHGTQKFYLDVVETKPGNAITIIDTDVNVDFAPPKDYKEEKKKHVPTERKVQAKPDDEGKDNGIVWGSSFKKARKASYFSNLKEGNTLSGRKPKRPGLGTKSKASPAKAGWGAPAKKTSKPFGGKGYSLK